ncbi:MAG: hypothetical protein L6262_05615 [Weeksellaceae bacterium]|nr:hypothetical protein [Weeksellaceae bacterium]
MKRIILAFAVSVMMIANMAAQTMPTAKQIIDNYVSAVGGRQKLESVKTLSMKNTINAMGMEFEGKTIKKDNKYKSTQDVMGQEWVQIFDGEKGYANQMGQKVDFPADQIAKLKTAKVMEALGLDPTKIKTVEKQQLDGKDYYLLTSDDSKYYFDVATGLLYKTDSAKGGTTINKYTDVDGIKFFEEMTMDMGGQEINVKNSEIKINPPISDDEFKL